MTAVSATFSGLAAFPVSLACCRCDFLFVSKILARTERMRSRAHETGLGNSNCSVRFRIHTQNRSHFHMFLFSFFLSISGFQLVSTNLTNKGLMIVIMSECDKKKETLCFMLCSGRGLRLCVYDLLISWLPLLYGCVYSLRAEFKTCPSFVFFPILASLLLLQRQKQKQIE